MATAKPSKKQRGKQKKAAAKVNAKGVGAKAVVSGIKLAPVRNQHVTFNDEGDAQPKAVAVTGKKRGRGAAATAKPSKERKQEETPAQGGGKSDRSAEMIQSAKYYLDQWKAREDPVAEGMEPWKFKKVKQLWILRWMFEADVIPKSMFTVVLEYLDGMQGVARQRVLESAHEIIDAGVPEKTEDGDAEEQDVVTRLTRRRYKRALQIAELLS